jgi:hypothetical protein
MIGTVNSQVDTLSLNSHYPKYPLSIGFESLPFRVLANVAYYIAEGADFVAWLESCGQSPNFRHLLRILDARVALRIKPEKLWPVLRITKEIQTDAELIGMISPFYPKVCLTYSRLYSTGSKTWDLLIRVAYHQAKKFICRSLMKCWVIKKPSYSQRQSSNQR